MRELIQEYGVAAAARAAAVHISIGVVTPGQKSPLVIEAEARLERAREALEDAITQAAALVSQAIGEVEAIEQARPQQYADDPAITEGYRANFSRPHNARRPFTLKDARPRARYSARLLREAWELLDPSTRPSAPG